MEEYLAYMLGARGSEDQILQKLQMLREQLQEMISLRIDMNEFIALIFFCDFDFEKYLGL